MARVNMLEWVCILSLLLLCCNCEVGPFMYYVTEPDFRTAFINVTHMVEDRSLLDPGYIFLGPYSPKDEDRVTLGPQIFDIFGNLVWNGYGTADNDVHNFRACDYLGEEGNHICWMDRIFVQGTGEHRSSNRIFNSSYIQEGRNYGAVDAMMYPNPHEFNVLRGGRSYIHVVFQKKPMDLTPYAGGADGWIFDGCFQEIDIQTGEPLFTWCLSDHIPLWHTYVYLFIPENTVNYTEWVVGLGTQPAPWDNYHLNSIDKDENGDYMLSIRHLNKILKVAGNTNTAGHRPGEIIWNMGGKESDVELGALHFSRQHHARFVSYNKTHRTISLFNNGFEDRNGQLESNTSTAQILLIDEAHKKATLLHEYVNPDNKMCVAQGSAQVLPNGNMFVGWGYCPTISEYSEDGTLLFHAHFAVGDEVSYRAFKMPWVGHPLTPPKLVAYTLSCKVGPDSPLYGYVSWNGATEVRSWRFYISTMTKHGPWISAGTYRTQGFESRVDLSHALKGVGSFARYAYVEALDKDGTILGNTVAETFVPIEQLVPECTTFGCTAWFSFPSNMNVADTCPSSIIPSVVALLVTILGVESLGYLLAIPLCWIKPTGGEQQQSYEAIPTTSGAQQGSDLLGVPSDATKPSLKKKRSGLESIDRATLSEKRAASGFEV